MDQPAIKPRIDSPARLLDWLEAPGPAVFFGQDLRVYSDVLAARPLLGCAFLGCTLSPLLAELAALQGCLIMPRLEGVPFDAYLPTLYSPQQLYDLFDPDDPVDSYARCLDWRIYCSFMDPVSRRPRPTGLEEVLARRLHDGAISEALHAILDLPTRLRTVAIMGGHDVPRGTALYAEVARLAQQLTQQGYLLLTGGGPGLMEAANLGAYTAGFRQASVRLEQALQGLAAAPVYHHPLWLATAHRVWQQLGPPDDPHQSLNLGIPTWFYGHEPPNVFATHIAKYFENSLREEGLLAVALGGVIFAAGNAGTVQEIFQDACQNYYRTYENHRSPMVLLGRDHWQVQKPAHPLLYQLAAEKGFAALLLLTDQPREALAFIRQHSPLVSPAAPTA